MMERFVGIDPGLTGAVAIIDQDGENPILFDMPTRPWGEKKNMVCVEGLRWILETHAPGAKVVIERVQAIPGRTDPRTGKPATQGSASSFNFGYGAGLLEATCVCYNHPYRLVVPTVWKRFHELLKTEKDTARLKAIEMWPDAELHLKKHSGRADALLLADYGRRQTGW